MNSSLAYLSSKSFNIRVKGVLYFKQTIDKSLEAYQYIDVFYVTIIVNWT